MRPRLLDFARLLLLAALLAGAVAVEDGSEQQAGVEEEEAVDASSAADAASLSYLPYPIYTSVPADYVLTNSTYGYTLAKVAQQGAKAVIFTCVRLEPGDDEEEVLSLVVNFGHSLHNVGLLEHMMMITTDERCARVPYRCAQTAPRAGPGRRRPGTCRLTPRPRALPRPRTWKILRHRGLPVYLDRSFPRRQAYVETLKPADTLNSVRAAAAAAAAAAGAERGQACGPRPPRLPGLPSALPVVTSPAAAAARPPRRRRWTSRSTGGRCASCRPGCACSTWTRTAWC